MKSSSPCATVKREKLRVMCIRDVPFGLFRRNVLWWRPSFTCKCDFKACTLTDTHFLCSHKWLPPSAEPTNQLPALRGRKTSSIFYILLPSQCSPSPPLESWSPYSANTPTLSCCVHWNALCYKSSMCEVKNHHGFLHDGVSSHSSRLWTEIAAQ